MKIFGIEIRKAKEQRSITIGPSTSVGLPYGGLSSSLSSEVAMKLSAVYRCVDVLGSDIGTMPWDVMVFKRGEEWTRDDNHFSFSMLNEQPNPSCSAFVFKKSLVSQMLLNGNGYARIYRDDRGNPTKLELLTGSVTMYITKPDLNIYYTYLDTYSHEEIYIAGEDMIHVPNFTYDGLIGVSTLTHASNITSLASSADGQAKGFFQSGANLSGILSVPGKIDSTKAQALKTAWGEAFKLSSTTGIAGGVAVMEGGADFKPVMVNPKDAQMLETRTFNVVDICRFFGVHPSKCFDTKADAYANVENYQLGHITDCMTPLATKIDNEVNRKLYRPSQRDRTKVHLRVRELLSNDWDSKSNYYTKMFQVGAYSPNDIRREIKQPLVNDGDKSYVQVNLVELGKEPTPDQNKNTNVVTNAVDSE
jgi:HK97 family phage portal protein